MSQVSRGASFVSFMSAVVVCFLIGGFSQFGSAEVEQKIESPNADIIHDLQDAIEMAEVQYEIKKQEIRIAELELEAEYNNGTKQFIEMAKAKLVSAQSSADRVKQLVKKGAASTRELEQANARVAAARAQLVQYESVLNKSRILGAIGKAKIDLLKLHAKSSELKVKQLKRKLDRLK